MKKLNVVYISLCLIATMSMMGSCLKGKGDVVSQPFFVESFTGVENNTDADITLTQAPTYAIEIVAQKNIIDNIDLSVKGGILIIKFKKKATHYEPIQININMPTLSHLYLNGSGDISTSSTFNDCETVVADVSGSGDLFASINVTGRTYSTISGSGNLTLSGSSPYHEMTISGSGDIYSFPFSTTNAVVNSSGSGNCRLSAMSTLYVISSGSGDVYYREHPVITLEMSGSGQLYDAN